MHSRLGKIDYASLEKYQDYVHLFKSFGLARVGDSGATHNLRDFLAQALYNERTHWYLSRGKRQAVSFRTNRIEEHCTRVISNFQRITPINWVWEITDYNERVVSGYVMAKSEEEAEQLGKMMYLAKHVWVRRKTPAIDKAAFCDYQSSNVKRLQDKIRDNNARIKSLHEANAGIQQKITTLQTNLMIFLDD